MKRRILSLLLAINMCFSLIPMTVFAAPEMAPVQNTADESKTSNGETDGTADLAFSDGGTTSNPYLIASLGDLEQLCSDVNGGNAYAGKYFKLTKDIDMSSKYSSDTGTNWTPIGTPTKPFSGIFDGNGHTISNLYINKYGGTADSYKYQGLFGYLSNATVKNLTVTGSVTGYQYVGGIAGYATGTTTIEDCKNEATVVAEISYAGGIVGRASGEQTTIERCANTGTVRLKTNSNNEKIGGIAGSANCKISKCYNTGYISARGHYAGGVVGYLGSTGSVKDCYNIGKVYWNSSSYKVLYLGGIVGYVDGGTVATSYNNGSVTYWTAGNYSDYGGAVGGCSGDGVKSNVVHTSSNNGLGTYITTAELGNGSNSCFDDWDRSIWNMDGDRPLLINNVEKGSAADPYLISNIAELEAFRDNINSSSAQDNYRSATFKLTADINLSTKYGAGKSSWEPIGSYTYSFNGTFDGNGHKITGLYVRASEIESSYVTSYGLFGTIKSATIKNLYVQGEVYADKTGGNDGVAGIVGYVRGDGTCYIENCESAVSVEAARNSTYDTSSGYTSYAGGIVGAMNRYSAIVEIRNCKNTGSIKGTGSYVGGIAGYVSSQNGGSMIENCINTGSVTCTLDVNAGDIADTITNEDHKKLRVGGIVGYFSGKIRSSYNTGTITVPSGGTAVGGVIGYATTTGIDGDSLIYLKGCNGTNTVFDSTVGTEMTSTQFGNGEATWYLQNGQTADADGNVAQAWGQLLKGSSKDALPVLSDESAKTVYQVTFVNDSKSYENDNTTGILTRKYVNRGGSLGTDLPTGTSTSKYDFEHWSYGENLEEKFEANTVVNSDKVVYSVGREKPSSVDGESYTIALNKNKTIDDIVLADYVGSDLTDKYSAYTFSVVGTDDMPQGLRLDADGKKIIGTPEKVGKYYVRFNITNNSLSLMGVEENVLSLVLNVGLEGEGDAEKPYLINNLEELEYFRDDVNDGNDYKTKVVKLTSNIDIATKYKLSGQKWEPIGDDEHNMFNGTFDGNGKEIDVYIVRENKDHVGLFGYLNGNGTIKNLGVTGTVSGKSYVGGIVAESKSSDSVIENCYNAANVTATGTQSNVGGIAGYSCSKIKNCYNTGKITGLKNVGGIAGYAANYIWGCYNVGQVSGDNDINVYAIVGSTTRRLSDCYYLIGTASLGDDYRSSEKKTAEQFKSGEVAWLLQEGQTEQIWGQQLTNTSNTDTSNQDTYPVLTSSPDKKVYKIEFKCKRAYSDDYSIHDTKYANATGLKSDNFPDVPTAQNWVFRNWSITEGTDGEVFDETTTPITSDMTVYAVGTEKAIAGVNQNYTITGKKGEAIEDITLLDYVQNNAGENDNFSISLATGETLPEGLTLADGKITGSPTKAVLKDVKFDVISSEISLMGGLTDSGTSLTLTFNIGLKGSGTATDPYLIEDRSDLEYFRDDVKAGNEYSGKVVKLVNDIDLEGNDSNQWTPIRYFEGQFNGNNHTIKNIYIKNYSVDNAGLFRYISCGSVYNLNVTGSISAVGSSNHVGGITGYADRSWITNCSSSVAVSGEGYVGGIAGRMIDGTVQYCYSVGTTDVVVSGALRSNIKNCYYLASAENDNGGKTLEQFKSGEVAWLLQNAQGEGSAQVWGQHLTNTSETATSNQDTYPVLTSDTEKKVNKLTFRKKNTGESAETYETHAVKYANENLNYYSFPYGPISDNYTFMYWAKSESVDEDEKFDYTTEITSDMTLYAVGREKTESESDNNVKLKKNVKMTDIDLNDYVSGKSGATKNFTFELGYGDLPEGVTFSGSKISGTPTAAGYYDIRVLYTNNTISLMSLPYEAPTSESLTLMGVDDGNFWIHFDVELEGSGTQADPYKISKLADLVYFRDRINKNIEGDTFGSKYFKLTDDIDMSGSYGYLYDGEVWYYIYWEPIAKDGGFSGTFDGGNHKISGLYTYQNQDYQGLFGKNSGTIKNLGVGGTVKGKENVGGIAGENGGTIEHCYSECEVNGKNRVGGIAGNNTADGKIINCYNTGTVTGNSEVGGIVSQTNGIVKNCYSVGTVTGAGFNGLFGSVGSVENISNCYYLDTSTVNHTTETGRFESRKADEFERGHVAWLLQNAQTETDDDGKVIQVWGQHLTNTSDTATSNQDKYPVFTSDEAKRVYRVALMANNAYKEGSDYGLKADAYGNKGDTVTLLTYDSIGVEEYKPYFFGWSTAKNGTTAVAYDHTVTEDVELYSIWNKVTFSVDGVNQTYLADNERKITITPLINGVADSTKLTADDFVIKYYKVNENSGKLESSLPVSKAVEIGKYLYVISYKTPKEDEPYGYRNVGTDNFVESSKFFKEWDSSNYDLFGPLDFADVPRYENIGFMYIKSGAETAQQPVYFDDLVVNTTMTGTVNNEFHNSNAGSTTKFRSTNTSVATVGENDGNVTIKGVGTTVIIATSSKTDSSDVYASYTLNVTKEVVTVTANNQNLTYGNEFSTLTNGYTLSNSEAAENITGTALFTTDYNQQNGVGKYEINVSGLESEKYELEFKSGTLTVGKKTLTAADFTVTTEGKAYDGTKTANVNAVVKADSLVGDDVITVIASGSFNEAAAGTRTVSYSVTGLSGKDSSNYVLSGTITGTIENVVISRAIVTISVPKTTTYVYDGEAKSVNAIGYAGGMYFDSFKVKYQKYNEDKTGLLGEKLDEVTEVGEYKVFVEVTDSNYMLSETDVIDASVKIKSAQQDYFTIEGISDTVTYGDTLTLQTAGAIEGGNVKYTLTEGASIAHFDETNPNKLIITGIGKVTVKATSTKANYAPKTASRSFTVNQKTVTVSASAPAREYNGTKNAHVVLTFDGVLEADRDYVAVACTSATVATADVENDKTVFVNGIYLSGTKAANYRLYSTTLQTSMNITQKLITGADIEVADKIYDGTTDVKSYKVNELTGVIEADKDFVTLTATASFENANVGTDKRVNFSDYVLSGAKSGNYKLDFAGSPEFTASITKATVSLEFGTLSYVYDPDKTRTVPIKATANGENFDELTVTYAGEESQKNVGTYEIEIALNEEIAGNYTLDYPEKKYLEIVKADQTEMTITGLPGTVSYGKTFTLQAVGGRSDITTVWSSTNEALAKVDALGNVTITGANGDAVTITATKAATSNYTEQKASITFVPTKQAATFKITNLKQTYDCTKKPVTIETNASELDDDETTRIDYYTVTYSVEDGTALTGAPINAGTYYVTVKATGNYEGEQHATLIVEKAENPNKYDIVISEDIVYGKEYSVTPVEVVGSEYVPLEVGSITYKGASLAGEQTEKPKNAGTYFAIFTLSDANYETVTVEKEFTIGKRTLMATVDEENSTLTRAYGETDEEIVVKLGGFAYEENESVVLMKPTAKSKANVYSVPGTYDIVISGGYDENYKFAYDATKKLTVTKLESGYFRIVGGNPSPYVNNMFDLTAYVNDWTADVTWKSKNTDVATVDENGRVTVVGEGTAIITATMNDARFKADEPAEFTLVAVRLPEIQKNIYFAENLVEKNVGDEKFTNTLSEASEGATVKYTSGNTNVATVDENTGLVTIVGPGRTTIKASAEKFNCETVYAQYTLVVSKVHFTIKADDMTITYGEAFDETEAGVNDGATLDGNFEGELKFRTSYRTGKNAGEYDIVPYGVTSKIYDVEFVAGTLTVEKKVLGAGDFEVEVSDKVYDGECDAKIKAEVKSSEIVGSDKLNVAVNGSFNSSDAGTKSVTYSITGLSGVGYENYVLENTEGLTTEAENGITKCPVEFFVSERTERIYDGKVQSVEITATANGKYFDKKNYTVYYTPQEGGATVTEPINIGTYVVSVALSENDFNKNYEASDIDAVLVIGLDIEDRLTITGTKKNVTVGDEIRLYAHYGNRVAEVEWNIKNGAEFAEINNVTGELKIKAEGTVTIIAKMTDPNYDGIEAEITLEAAKKKITLAVLPDELTKTYNGEEQYVKFTSEDVELYDENDEIELDVSYVKDGKTTSYVKDAGTYTVYYKVNDKRYACEGNLTVKVEKAVVTVNAKDIKKEYGEEPIYELEVSSNVKGVDESTMLELVEFESPGAPKTANVGTYDIEVTLKKTTDDNCIYVVDEENNGKLEVTKATLTVNVDDVTREYGKENPKEIDYTVSGFKNDDEKTVKVTVTPKYLEDKFEETVGTHTDAVEALVTCDSGNYVIEIVYKEGNAADLIITKIPVKANAVTAKTSALTVKLDKIISGLGKDNFKVTDGDNNPVELREVTVANDGKTYTLKGSFKAGTVYTVTPTLEGTEADEIYEIVSDPLTMKVSKSTGGGMGGGGAGSSGTAVTYTVKFETNGAKAIEDVKVAKNAKVERPADPEREGFEFAGWFADEKLESEYDFDAKVTENITLYAKWTEKKDEADNKDDTENKEPTLTPKTFDDVKNGDWFKDDVDYVSSRGIMNGVSDNSFDPAGKVTRGMMVTILYRLEGEPTVEGECPFDDVEDGKYYAKAVLWCYQNGIVNGISDTEYAPEDYVTREQMAAILYRYAQYKDYDVTEGGMRIREFADYEDISEYALNALTWTVNTGLVNGKDGNKIAPADTASRAEIAAVLHRFIEAYSISD